MSEKNPKESFGIRKVSMSTIPAFVLLELGLALQEGAAKYGRHNYRSVGNIKSSVYYDSVFRHLMAWWEGEDEDPDSGLSHITKAIASLVVLRDAMMQDNHLDDRPPKSSPEWMNEFNAAATKLCEKYPNPVKPHTQMDID